MIPCTVFLLLFSSATAEDSPTSQSISGSQRSLFSIEPAAAHPSTQLFVQIPARHPLYTQFIAKVVDITNAIDDSIRDENRTVSPSPADSTQISIQNLHPGHRYSISLFGQKEDKSELIKEESVVMRPRAPEFPTDGVNPGRTNITLVTDKDIRAVQDSFLIEYRQLDPEKKFPLLEVLDIPEQKQLEVYLGNLSPGRDYSVSMTARKDGMKSKPWTATLTTLPSPVTSLSLIDNSTCVVLQWEAGEGGADAYVIEYKMTGTENVIKTTVRAPVNSHDVCEGIVPGASYTFSVVTKKTVTLSQPAVIEHVVRPLTPTDFKVRPEISKGKYKLTSDLPATSNYDKCQVTVVSSTLDKTEAVGEVQEKNSRKTCNVYLLLIPGERYEFSLSASSLSVHSAKLSRSVVLSPAFDMKGFGLSIQENNDALKLAWPQSEVFMTRMKDIWNKVVGADSQLQMRISPTSGGGKSRQFDSSPNRPSQITVPGLTKGACYKIQVYTVTKSGIVSESRFNESFRMSAPPVNSSLTDISRTSATLNMTLLSKRDRLPDCVLTMVVLDMHSQTVFDKRLPLSTPLPVIELNGLRPFHKYTINTQIVCGTGTSACSPSTRTMKQLTFSTQQDKPGPVQSLTGRALNPYSIQMGWLPPALPNGVLTHYIAEVTPQDSSILPWTVTVGLGSDRADHALEAIVDGLQGGQRYNFSVRAVTVAGPGEPPAGGPIRLTMPIMAPPQPANPPQAIPETIGPQSLSVRYSSSIFDPKHGRIIRSALIVSEVTEDGRISETWMQAKNETYTWLQVQRFDVWPAYMASLIEVSRQNKPSPPLTISEAIGVDVACEDLPLDTVCNGPLKAGTLYKFKIRLYTAPNLYADSPYSQIITTDPLPRGVSLRLVVLLLAILVLLGLSGVLLIALWNRSKKARNAAYSSSSKESQWAALKMIMAERAADCLAKLGLDGSQNVPPVDVHNNLQPPFGHHRRCRSLRERTGVDHRLERLPSGPIHKTPLYTVMTGGNMYKSRPVRKTDFEAHVRNMSADSEFRFSEEYEMLKNIGVGQSFHAADVPVNRAKNRFTNILPYDHSRVKLTPIDDEEGSDYINANYMPGFSSRREFIAAQGPLPSTRDSFWQMAWEQQCPAIIALTKCVEKGRDKCHQYWPDAEHMSVIYADIEVTLMCETQYEEFTIRELRLTRLHDPSPPRIVRHLHYMAWPDFGVPEHPEGIIRFARLFRAKLPHSPHNKPTIVHCSAGVGRSGTFMTIDRLLQTIQMDRHIDVFGIVHEMRLERCHMVQNEQQYIFIHHCILHALQTGGSDRITVTPSSLEIHQNPAFEEDEGIEESGF